MSARRIASPNSNPAAEASHDLPGIASVLFGARPHSRRRTLQNVRRRTLSQGGVVTKLRQPLTFENALTKVASEIGWATVAQIVGQAETTVRNWSDPDTTARITLEAAFRLDAEWRQRVGEGAPFITCYAARLDADSRDVLADRDALLSEAAIVARDSGQAAGSAIAAAKIGASESDLVVAERDLERAIGADAAALACVRQLRRSERQTPCGCPEGSHVGTGEPPEETARAMEVAPPAVTA
jgi:hypothetical protein